MDFLEILPLRFHLAAKQSICFPPGKASNILRGGFGRAFRAIACSPDCPSAAACRFRTQCPYASIFEPKLDSGPSGLADAPRPFVFRAPHLDAQTFNPGQQFHFDLHLFDLRPQIIAYFISAFQQLTETGIGPARGAAHLHSVSVLNGSRHAVSQIYSGGILHANVPCLPIQIPLTPSLEPVTAVSIQFLTPTELRKNQPTSSAPPFAVLLARLRDRISNLLTLYGPGQPDFDFTGMNTRAQEIETTNAALVHRSATRYSGTQAGSHPLGGFVGNMRFKGDLAEFLPLLKAGEWTGVGRHTVWGNGQLEVWAR